MTINTVTVEQVLNLSSKWIQIEDYYTTFRGKGYKGTNSSSVFKDRLVRYFNKRYPKQLITSRKRIDLTIRHIYRTGPCQDRYWIIRFTTVEI